jgi:hypothetical protein
LKYFNTAGEKENTNSDLKVIEIQKLLRKKYIRKTTNTSPRKGGTKVSFQNSAMATSIRKISIANARHAFLKTNTRDFKRHHSRFADCLQITPLAGTFY